MPCAGVCASDRTSLTARPGFKLMFPDRLLLNGQQQSDPKIQYVIKYGIADHFKKQLIYDVKNTPYSFLFDETTNSQVKKQYG